MQRPRDREMEHEVALARRRALDAEIATLEGNDSIYAQTLGVEYQAIRDLTDGSEAGSEPGLTEQSTLRLTAMRARGEIGDLASQRVEEAPDRADIYAMRYGGDA